MQSNREIQGNYECKKTKQRAGGQVVEEVTLNWGLAVK
jgi:hypothetical protein